MAPLVSNVLDRIADRDAARRQRASDATADREQTQHMDVEDAQRQLDMMQQTIAARLRTSVDHQANEQDLRAITADMERLEQGIAARAWLLPPYALRKAEDGAASLRLQLRAALAAARPRKRFGFSAGSKGSADAAAPSAEAAAQPAVQPAAPRAAGTGGDRPGSTLRGLRRQRVVKQAGELAGGDFTLEDLEDCTVLLLGRLSALRLLRARRCCIVAGPVAGAAYLEGVTDCQVALAAHQVRVHASSGSSVFLDVRSNPIIEHCTAMGFGPLTPQQRQLLSVPETPCVQPATAASAAAAAAAAGEAACSNSSSAGAAAQPGVPDAAAGAAAGGTSNCWRAVQDFNWLRSTPSPNWHILTDDEVRTAACPTLD